ncbi:MAG: alpha/beta family hydrolase [Gammaproteobacteria bacterium]
MKFLRRTVPVTPDIQVSAVWALPAGYRPGQDPALVLAHGAGNDMDSPFISHVHEALAGRGVLTVKFNFPYKQRGARAPDRAPVLEDTWRAVIESVRGDSVLAPGALFLGGKSMGGRIASQVVAGGEAAAGLVLLGYPLHPAGKPDRLRSAHLPGVSCPMLFIEGTRDPLCDLALLETALEPVAVPVKLHVIEGGDHSFRVLKRLGRSEAEVGAEIVTTTADWIARTPKPGSDPSFL